MTCRICNSAIKEIFKGNILQKYEISYFQCLNCGFIQTEDPFWLEEAYKNAIARLDIGIVSRNLMIKDSILPLLNRIDGKDEIPYLDVGGGYGLFVRLMRDSGFNFCLFDPHCENLFARGFSKGEDELKEGKFQAVTFFEVLEHTENPFSFLINYRNLSDTFIFSTELIPKKKLNSVNDWWYFAPESGQHISFFSAKSLQYLAKRIGCKYYSDGGFLHCFSSRILPKNPFKEKLFRKVLLKLEALALKGTRKESLLQKDFLNIKAQLRDESSF